ncbi:trihelix transcription factor GTL1-like [Nymphaea colorata]|nr:trihelix transcription factor GTL1-like [Nymphaea colorata]
MQSGLEYASVPDHIQQIISTRSSLHHHHHLTPQPFFGINPVIDTNLEEQQQHHHLLDNSPSHELHLLHHFQQQQQQHSHGLVQDPFMVHGHERSLCREMEEDEGGEDNGEREEEEERRGAARRVEAEGGRPVHEHNNRWPREETLALLKIRSSMEATIHDSNFKGPIWEHVSRKLAELGFHRSAKKCKEKFENVTKYYKKTKDGRQDGKNYRFYSEIEALYNGSNINKGGAPTNQGKMIMGSSTAEKNCEGTSEDETLENPSLAEGTQLAGESTSKKRKKSRSFEEMKGLCQEMVKQMMEQQEELQRKFLEAVEKRDHERIQREEAWKRQEMARMSRETETRTQEQALASNREAAIIGFLRKLTEESQGEGAPLNPNQQSPDSHDLNPDPDPNPNPRTNPIPVQGEVPPTDLAGPSGKTGPTHLKRWPRSEVYALIKLRCKHEESFKDNNSKGSLWEKISQEMVQLGYMRSAKRCKEKWENINKYFRKTKDAAKARPPDSKTCPYFHQLSKLYQNGVLSFPSQKHLDVPPENSAYVPQDCSENHLVADSGAAESSGCDYGGGMMGMGGDVVEAQSTLMELVCKISSDHYNSAG